MKTFLKIIMYILLGAILLGLLKSIFIYGLLAFCIYYIGKKMYLFVKEKRASKKLAEEIKVQSDKIEYKMANLLKMSGNYIDSPAVRNAYKEKEELNLQDKWHKFLDLRAKLELNNTPTGKAEAVLHVMCDEILNRLQNVHIEVTEPVKKEFIEENLMPLMDDINEILGGLKPADEIDINAYELLKDYDLEKLY